MLNQLKSLGQQFGITYLCTFTTCFALHVIVLLVVSYVAQEFLVVSGLKFWEWEWYYRALSLVPYLILPSFVAGIRLVKEVSHLAQEQSGTPDHEGTSK